MWILYLVNRRALMGNEPLAIHQKLILLCLATKDWMILEDQTFHSPTGIALEKQSRCEPADAASDYDAIVDLAGIGDILWQRIIEAVADRVTCLQNFPGIAV